MPATFGWDMLALRLALALVAGGLVGINRGEHGRPVGLRTTMLVCLAATVAMIQVNLLLPMAGKAPDSFVTNDLMRLPLGILTGVGFIGGGAILRHGDKVQGVTTAATLWMVTVIGLCFGGGQLWLGTIATALSLATLWALKLAEARMPQEHQAGLALLLEPDGPEIASISDWLAAAGFEVRLKALEHDENRHRHLEVELRWHARADAEPLASFMKELAGGPGVISVKWAYRKGAPL